MSIDEEKRKIARAILTVSVLIALLWLIKAVEIAFSIPFTRFGILPLQVEGLKGIIFSPLIHGSIKHLISNSVPLFLLGSALFYYYKPKATEIFILAWVLTGFWVWLFARGSAYHIGASGVVYALAAFHFVSGIIRREPKLIAFTLLVTFLYGSFVWGIFPGFSLEERISWESHLMGAVAGIVLAYTYRTVGPQRAIYQWPEEDEVDSLEEFPEEPDDDQQKPV